MHRYFLFAFVLLAGCGPSQESYDEALVEIDIVKKENEVLMREVDSLKSDIERKDKEIYDLKYGPGNLLDSAKKSEKSVDKLKYLEDLLFRYPSSSEAKEASILLMEVKQKVADDEFELRKAAVLSKKCLIDGDLPKEFDGTDVSEVIKDFERIKEKGEFESTSDYKTRLSEEIKGAGSDIQCAVLNNGWGTKYDADNKRWNVEIEAKSDYQRQSYQLQVIKRIISDESYVGSNSFGVKADVRDTKSILHGVEFSQRNFNRALKSLGARDTPIYDFIAYIPMSPESARAISRNDLKILIQYKWIPEYVFKDRTYRSATIDSPWDDVTGVRMIQGEIMRIVIFNQRTGKILRSSGIL